MKVYFFESLCESSEMPGTYDKEKLAELVRTTIDDLPFSIHHFPFVMKVRRSCVRHDIGYPPWAEEW